MRTLSLIALVGILAVMPSAAQSKKSPTVSVIPSSLTIETNTAFQFVASVKGYGNDRYVLWKATLGQDPNGTETCRQDDAGLAISDTGLFVAPNFATTCLITATHYATGVSAVAIVTIVPPL